ncbi:hypothetical protein TD95_003942 [Thielaviopsis punctulata]|uniref:Uncharacterized protein n=1 Tax=Thielaviopsis punctulata TaxID=72032 RepID=A0A0F4ZDK0_9PEZI|nr:hypothetical protein TD95_003942 [Thielaviopsis punctulata]
MASVLLRRLCLQRQLAGRSVSSLASNSYIKVFKDHPAPGRHLLSLLEMDPPSPALAIGTTTQLPPTPGSFAENADFRRILDQVVQEHGHRDSGLQAQAKAFVGAGGTAMFTAMQQTRHRGRKTAAADATAGATSGGYIHLSDARNPPDFGRIAWPEDILGSVEVDGEGEIIGRVEPSGTYRIVTNEGILGLSPFLMEKLVERLRAEQTKVQQS